MQDMLQVPSHGRSQSANVGKDPSLDVDKVVKDPSNYLIIRKAERLDDEIKLRKIIHDQVTPVIGIIKENMVTNCFKNDQLKNAREDMQQINERQYQIKEELKKVDSVHEEMVKIEKRLNYEIRRVEEKFRPVVKQISDLQKQDIGFENKIKALEIQQKVNSQTIQDIQALIHKSHATNKSDIKDLNTTFQAQIDQLTPEISSVRQDCLDYYQQVQSFQKRFESIDSEILESQKKHYKIVSSINNLREQEIQQVKKSIRKCDLKCEQYDMIMKKINENVLECQGYVEESRKTAEDFYRLQPFMTAMQISDYMQEFLCAPDQLKLVDFDNKKLKNLREFAMEIQNFGEYFKNLEKLREMLQTKRLGLIRVDLVRDLVLNETRDIDKEEKIFQGMADVKINPRKKFTNFTQKLELTSQDLLDSHKRKTQSYALEKQIIQVNKKLKNIKKKKEIEEKQKQEEANDPQALMKACPLLNFGAKMLDILDIDQKKKEKEEKNRNEGSSCSIEDDDNASPKYRGSQVVSNQKSSKKTVSFSKDAKQGDQNSFSAQDHKLFHQLHTQVQLLQKKFDDFTAEDDSEHESSSSSDGDDSDSSPKRKDDKHAEKTPTSPAKSTARHQQRDNAIIEQIMKQNEQREEKLSVQREQLIKQIDLLMNTQLKCSRCGFKNSKLDQMEECGGGMEDQRVPLKKNNHGGDGGMAAGSSYVGSGLPNTLTKVVYIKGQSKIDRFQYRFFMKRRNEVSRQFDPFKRYQRELQQALKRERAEFRDYLEYQSVQEKNQDETSNSYEFSQENSQEMEPILKTQNMNSNNSLQTDESMKKMTGLGSKNSLDAATKAQNLRQKLIDELQAKRTSYQKKVDGLNDQIALMIVHEQQSIGNQSLLKQDILQKQLSHQLLFNLRESLLLQVNHGKITKNLAREIYDQRFDQLNVNNSLGLNQQELLIEEGPVQDRFNMPRRSSAVMEYMEGSGPKFSNVKINQHQNQMSSASNGLIQSTPNRASEPFKLTITNSSRVGYKDSHLTGGLKREEITLMINKAIKKNEDLLSKKLRHEIGGEIKQLLTISKQKMVDDQRKVNNKYDNHLQKLKESFTSSDIFTRNKLELLDSLTSDLECQFSKITKEFSEQVDINKKIKQLQQTSEKQVKEFIKKLKEDYLDFFRDKTKMKQDLGKALHNIVEFKERVDEDLNRQEGWIEGQRRVLQILAEQGSYVSCIVGQDLRNRMVMVERVQQQRVVEDDKNLIANAKVRGKSARPGLVKNDSGRVQIPSIIKNIPLDPDSNGSLYLKSLIYRNCDIEFEDYLRHLSQMEQSMQSYFEKMIDYEKEVDQEISRKHCQTAVIQTNNSTFKLDDRKTSTKLGEFNADQGIEDLMIKIKMKEIHDKQQFDTVSYDHKPQRVFDDLILGKDINFEKNKFADKIKEINQNPFVNIAQFESLSSEALPKSRYKENMQDKATQGMSSNNSRLTKSNKIDVKSQSIFRQDNQRDQAITDSLSNIQGNFIGQMASSGSCSRRSSYRLNSKIKNNLDKSILQSDSKNRKFLNSSMKTSIQTKAQNQTSRYIPQKLHKNSRNLPLIQTSKNLKAPRMFNTFQSTQNNIKSQLQSLRGTEQDNVFDSNMKSSSNNNLDKSNVRVTMGLVSVQKNIVKSSESLGRVDGRKESVVRDGPSSGIGYQEGDTEIVDNQSGSLLITRGKNSKDQINFNEDFMFDSKSYGL